MPTLSSVLHLKSHCFVAQSCPTLCNPVHRKVTGQCRILLAGAPCLSWLDFRTKSAAIFLFSFFSPQILYKVSVLVKPNDCKSAHRAGMCGQAFDGWSWAAELWSLWVLLMPPLKGVGPVREDEDRAFSMCCKEKWQLRQGRGQRMGAALKEWEAAGLQESRPSYLAKTRGAEVRTGFWDCQGQWLDTVQKVCDFTVWEMKLESLLDTNELYFRPVGRRHHGNSFPFVENIKVCFSKDWHW